MYAWGVEVIFHSVLYVYVCVNVCVYVWGVEVMFHSALDVYVCVCMCTYVYVCVGC